ncbi:MAG: cold shock domain-containing protein [Alphaproteobacteria bacterium]|nr:MAG: cold shock domain-containing protein [Alphaproteobacteria bacterium]
MAVGVVKWFNARKGYGFIASPDWPKDVFFHVSAVRQARISGLREGDRLAFELEEDPGCPGRIIARRLRRLEGDEGPSAGRDG